MSTVALDVGAVRARFSALRAPTAFFDAPGGTQCPDSVIDAIAGYLRESNANVGGRFGSSRHTEALLALARLTAAAFLRCEPDEAIFGQNMTTLNFMLSRSVGRTLAAGDEILVTRLDHDANVSPWLELADDLDLKIGFVDVHDDTTLDLGDLERQLGERTRIVAFPLASNAAGTLTDTNRIVELAHDAGALAWADAVHYAPTCSSAGAPTRCDPPPSSRSGAASRPGRSRTSCSPASSRPSSTSSRSAGERSAPTS